MCLSACWAEGTKLEHYDEEMENKYLIFKVCCGVKWGYLYLVDGVDDDDDVPLMARRQSLKPAWKLLQDLTGLQGQAGDGPEVLQQLRGGRRTILYQGGGGRSGNLGGNRPTFTVSLLMMRTGSALAESGRPTK